MAEWMGGIFVCVHLQNVHDGCKSNLDKSYLKVTNSVPEKYHHLFKNSK